MKTEKLPVGMRRRENGTIQYRFQIDGKNHSVTGKTIAEIRKKTKELYSRLEKEQYITSDRVTVSEYFKRWIDSKRGTVKETTIRNYYMFGNMFENAAIDRAGTKFGELKIQDVEVQNVRDLQKVLAKNHTTRTTNDCVALVKSVFKSAIEEDRILTFNPAAAVRRLKRTEAPARDTIHRALTKDETRAFLTGAEESYNYRLYIFLLNTGCRIGEAAALQRRDITKDSVRICRTVTRTEVGGYMIGDDTKTAAGRRTIPLTVEAREALEEQQRFNALAFGKSDSITDTIFKSQHGKILKDSIVDSDIKRICTAAGIERFSVHALRDTFATRCIENGMQPKTLQEILGHSDIGMTMNLYAHVMPETKQEQMKAVNFL